MRNETVLKTDVFSATFVLCKRDFGKVKCFGRCCRFTQTVMVDVTRDTFSSLLPQIQDDIRNAKFVAFDCEFSGLGSNLKEAQPDLLDTPASRYLKVSRTCSEFLPLQIGICTFEYREKEDFYIAKPYNFYVFPSTGNRFFQLDRCFSTQISSMEFLLSHNFDWNKWATQGVPYVNHDDYERIMEKLGASDFDAPSPPEKGDSLYEFSQEVIGQAREFLQNSTDKKIQIAAPSAYHKRVIHISIAKNFNGFLGTTSKPTCVELVKYTEEEREEASAKSRYTTLKAELEELVGFRRIVDALVEAKVPLVGHNLLHGISWHLSRRIDDILIPFSSLQIYALCLKIFTVSFPLTLKTLNLRSAISFLLLLIPSWSPKPLRLSKPM